MDNKHKKLLNKCAPKHLIAVGKTTPAIVVIQVVRMFKLRNNNVPPRLAVGETVAVRIVRHQALVDRQILTVAVPAKAMADTGKMVVVLVPCKESQQKKL